MFGWVSDWSVAVTCRSLMLRACRHEVGIHNHGSVFRLWTPFLLPCDWGRDRPPQNGVLTFRWDVCTCRALLPCRTGVCLHAPHCAACRRHPWEPAGQHFLLRQLLSKQNVKPRLIQQICDLLWGMLPDLFAAKVVLLFWLLGGGRRLSRAEESRFCFV